MSSHRYTRLSTSPVRPHSDSSPHMSRVLGRARSSDDMHRLITMTPTLKGLAGLPVDLMTHTLSFCSGQELGIASCVHPYWNQTARHSRLWYNLYCMHTGSTAPPSSSSDWRSAYINRSSLWSRLKRARHSWKRILQYSIIFIIPGVLALIYGIFMASYQQSILSRAIGTPCMIDSSDVEITSRSSYGRDQTFTPIITYHYSWNNYNYTGNDIHGIHVFGAYPQFTKEMAYKLVNRFQTNNSTLVYVDPTNPSHSFLLDIPIFDPYMYIFITLGCACLLIPLYSSNLMGLGSQPSHTGATDEIPPPRVRLVDGEWGYEIMETRQVSSKKRMIMSIMTVICVHGIGSSSLLFFLYGTDNKAYRGDYASAGALFWLLQVFALIPTFVAFISYRVQRYVEEACIYTPTQETYFVPGKHHIMIVQQKANMDLYDYSVSVHVECREYYRELADIRSRTIHSQQWIVDTEATPIQHVSAGSSVLVRGSLALPVGVHPSVHGNALPQYLWGITIETRAQQAPTYTKHVAIHVTAAPTE